MQAERRPIAPAAFALGSLLVFYPGALLVAGRAYDADWLVVAAFFVGLSLLRGIVGDIPSEASDIGERLAKALHWLPRLYAAFFAGLSVWIAAQFGSGDLHGASLVWFGIGVWLVASLATCPGHELVHRRERWDRALGRVLGAVAGYPVLGHEHLSHHANPGNTKLGEYPRRDHSLYGFMRARLFGLKMWRAASEWDRGEQARRGRWRADGFAVSLVAWLMTWVMFSWIGGWRGAVWFGIQSAGIHLTLHLITFLQHWGLGDDSLEDASVGQYGWEDTCLSQALVTMGVSLHQAHHKAPSRPYYRLAPMGSSPRLPASYAVMMLVAFVPPLWRRMMNPALDYWLANPDRPIAPGRAIFCSPRVYRSPSESY